MVDAVEPIGLTLGIFLLIGVGVVARRLGILAFEDRQALNNIIIFLCLPALIFSAAREAPLEASLFIISAISLAISLTTLLLGYGLARLARLDGPLLGSFMLAAGVGNTGYLGYPLTQALLGREHLVKAVFFDIFGTVLILFTVGIYFANKYGHSSGRPARHALTYAAPNLAALILGFATANAQLPAPLELGVDSLAQATTAVIMLSIGVSLSLRFSRHWLPVGLLTTLKLAVMPLLGLGVALALDLPSAVGGVVVLQSSMPVALMTFVIGDKYRLDRDFLSGAIMASTALSMLTIPTWLTIVSLLNL